MKTLVSTAGMSREEWLNWRKRGIGGSEVAALVGLHPYLSPFSVYLDKVGTLASRDDTEAMRLGRDLEGYVAARFTEMTGIKTRRKPCILMDDTCDYMIADIDRWNKKAGIGLECKTMSPTSKAASGLEDNNVPPQYYIQCQWYMMITGFPVWHLAVLLLGRGFYTFAIDRNDADIAALRQAASAFWKDYVLPRKMPPPDGTPAAQAAIAGLTGAVDNNTQVHLTESVDALKELEHLNREIDTLKQRADAIKQQFLLSLGDAGMGWNSGYEVYARTTTRKTFDLKRFKAENPQINLDGYYKESMSRPFKFKIFGECVS